MLAVHALRLKRSDLHMQVVLTNAEPVHEYQRKVIAQAFGCPVRETYGMAELVAAASECTHGRMHVWPEVGIIEVIRDQVGDPHHIGGNLVCTGLFNMDMPLIRYEVGDRGSLAKDEACTCGCSLPMLGSVEGRADDVLYTVDARQIGRLDPVFKSHLPVIEAQIIQESLKRIRVRFVPAPEYQTRDGQSMIERLQARMGNVEVILEPMDQLPRESNGKFRAVISRIKPQEAASLASGQ